MADPKNLGYKVTFRQYSWFDMVVRAWGEEWSAPDRGTYLFNGARGFDSTDRSDVGFYRKGKKHIDATVLLPSAVGQGYVGLLGPVVPTPNYNVNLAGVSATGTLGTIVAASTLDALLAETGDRLALENGTGVIDLG